METVDLNEAQADLSRLVERAAGGEEFVIAKDRVPMARLVAYLPADRRPRVPGSWAGRVVIHPDFDGPPPEIAGAFS